MTQIESRRIYTRSRITELQSNLDSAASIIRGKACVYATGSFGRNEASVHSDLDLFIVGVPLDGKQDGSSLTRLNEICVKAELIDVTRKLSIKDFDGDGKYLVHHSVKDFTGTLGRPEDDITNTFTARLLLLLESQPLLGSDIYNIVIDDVIAAYWRDYEDHKTSFKPGFLANDILRLWRTFCVNYEARTEREPDNLKAKGKVKNYKLKHSRMLTCYSALLYLLTVFKKEQTVHPDNAREMVHLTPLERLDWIKRQAEAADATNELQGLTDTYNLFLQNSDFSETAMIEIFMDPAQAKKHMDDSYKFGDLMFGTINKIGDESFFHRLIVV